MKNEVDVVDLMTGVTMRIRIKRGTELKWRLWIGMSLIKLAALVMRCGVNVEPPEETRQ